MGLSIEPESKKFPMLLVSVLIIVIVGLALLWRQKDNLPQEVTRFLPQSLSNIVVTSTPPPSSRVRLVYSVVVTPENDAFTADLYLEEAESHINSAWSGIDGRIGLETYTVQAGDTLWRIAGQFGLDVDTLRWSNPDLERNPDLLAVGSELTIVPVIGAYHTVVEGDTLTAIAAQYGVAEADIVNYPLNNLGSASQLQPGDGLIIPNGRKEINIPAPGLDPDYPLAWPNRGRITQNYRPDHLAIDIGAPYGSDVYAAAAGTVGYARWARTGYGFTVIIDHGNGRETLYSHLKGALVRPGDSVERGQVIGQVGSTGNSTGPHVHFEVRENEVRIDPLDYLK